MSKQHKQAAELFAEPPETSQASYVQVALNLPMHKEFTYLLPAGMQAQIGHRVRVPFRNKVRPGVVTAVSSICELDPKKLRPVQQILDNSVQLPPSLLQLARRMAQDYGCSLGEALDAMLPAAAKKRGRKQVRCLQLNIPHDLVQQTIMELEDKHQGQARLLRAILEFGGPMPSRQACRQAGVSDSPAKTLCRHGQLKQVMIEEEGEPLVPEALEHAIRFDLNPEQAAAVEEVVGKLEPASHETYLLHGVTGSGKTEVYLRILEEVRKKGRTAIVLVPEISLTPQTVGRFASRFPDVAVLHSGLTETQRGAEWQRLMRGEANIAIGARSALFAPLQNLGLIVLDEEHEGSFKQESTPRYHARAMALARGEIENAVVVLGSATPSLESYGRARRGQYKMLTLPERAGMGRQPRIMVEDLRKEGKDSYVEGVVLSRTLQVQMAERLDARDQIILFLNRRGFSPVLICPACGTPTRCPHCDVSMTWHVRRARLVCHYCCEEKRLPELCPICENPKFHQLGVGTERVEAAVKKLFPQAVVARMDADTMTQRGAHERVLSAFRRRQIDVLVGTQMIAKGLDFPDVTLVGVISADTGLFLPDFRAAERSFQLLYQVAGRAGRAEKAGTVILQTYCPENYAVDCAARLDYEGFVQQELRFRKELRYPPFSRLVRVLVEGRQLGQVQREAQQICGLLHNLPDLQALGPAPTVIPRIKERHRMHALAKCFTDQAFQLCMDKLADVEARSTSSLRVILDVDPGSLL